MRWWVRPLVRMLAAFALPFVVPAVITGILWALPDDPVAILCPPSSCDEQAAQLLTERWHLSSPGNFLMTWFWNASHIDFGPSYRVLQGGTVWADMLADAADPPHPGAITSSLLLITLAGLLVTLISVLTALGLVPRRLDPVAVAVGVVPIVIISLVAAAVVEVRYGPLAVEAYTLREFLGMPLALFDSRFVPTHDGWPGTLRILLGALVLAVADGTLGGAVAGTRGVFDEEMKQRYIQMSLLRGEGALSNALPNVTPALIGQMRGRILQILSGAVIVEIVLGIPGLGELLWRGTLSQDFFVVMGAAWVFALISSALLLMQAAAEVLVELQVRRSPAVPLVTGQGGPVGANT